MIIRPATPADLGFCHDCARLFSEETQYPVLYDAQTSQRTFWAYINDPLRDILIAEADGIPLGGVMLVCSHEFSERPFCYIVKLFVLPLARGSTAGRLLMQATADWAAKAGCSHIFANAGASISARHDSVAGNLYRRCGFADAGAAFVKALDPNQPERIN
ncbi:MAG: GNAT family N-acetyltransferase [Alphaproteobacteria bacterium]